MTKRERRRAWQEGQPSHCVGGGRAGKAAATLPRLPAGQRLPSACILCLIWFLPGHIRKLASENQSNLPKVTRAGVDLGLSGTLWKGQGVGCDACV